jgi:hypothetical protein
MATIQFTSISAEKMWHAYGCPQVKTGTSGHAINTQDVRMSAGLKPNSKPPWMRKPPAPWLSYRAKTLAKAYNLTENDITNRSGVGGLISTDDVRARIFQ